MDFFNDAAGYGFISTDASDKDAFYHMEDVSGPDIREDEELSFNIVDSGKGPRAVDIERINGDTDSAYHNGESQKASRDVSKAEQNSEEMATDGQMTDVHISKALFLAAEVSLESGRNDEFHGQIESWSRDLIAAVVQQDPPDFVDDIELTEETVSIELPKEVVSHIKLFCDNPAEPFDDPNVFVEAAIRDALELEPGKTESITAEIPIELVRATETSQEVEIDALVEEAIEGVIRDS